MDGGTYIGPVDRLKRPHGLGKEYFPPSNKRQRLKYYGHYLNGKKHGNGTLYNVNGLDLQLAIATVVKLRSLMFNSLPNEALNVHFC